MITPKRNGTRVVFGPVRLCYPHLFERYAMPGDTGEGAYQTDLLIPKNEKETIDAIKAAIEEAKSVGKVKMWHGKVPAVLRDPLRDGDSPKNNGNDREPEYHGHLFMSAKSKKNRPGVVDRQGTPIMNEEEIYGGVWAIVSVNISPYNTGSSGIGCYLNNVMKFKDDEPFGNRVSPQTDFAGLNLDADDDDW